LLVRRIALVDGCNCVVVVRLLAYLSARHLGAPIGSIAHRRDDLTRALDWLFFGI